MHAFKNGDVLRGWETIDGEVQPVGGGGPIASSDVTDPLFGDVATGLSDLDTAIGTLNTDLTALSPTVVVTGSLAFTSGVYQTVWTYALAEGQAGSIAINNSIIWTGTAATLTTSQLRYYNSYRRVTGGVAQVQAGAPGAQGSILSTTAQLIASGNNIVLQLRFGVTATINYRLPIYLDEVQI